VSDCRFVEATVHRMLADKRVRKRREFFAIDVETARNTILAAAGSLALPYKHQNNVPPRRFRGRGLRWAQRRPYMRRGQRRGFFVVPFLELTGLIFVVIAVFRPRIPSGTPWLVADLMRVIELVGYRCLHSL
jgi:hypothetical protein